MDRELIKDYLTRSGMGDAPSEALAHIFAEMATKNDLATMRLQVDARFDRVDARFAHVDARFDQVDARFEQVEQLFDLKLTSLESRIDQKLEALKDELTKRMTGLIVVLATLMALIDLFID